jgi:polar amino acid transport system substrate-binding protein
MTRRIIAVLLSGAVLASAAGCVGAIGSATLTPKLSPPVIARPGVLRAAVDLSYPPFAGAVKGRQVGLDVDVASAIAEQLGLKLEIVDAKPAAAAALLASGSVDVALGGLTIESAVSSQLAFAGTYVSDAPAVFAAKDASGSAATAAAATAAPVSAATSATSGSDESAAVLSGLSGKRIAVQGGSLAYWTLLDVFGDGSLVVVQSLDEAFKAVVGGKADVAAGDALIGAYMLRGYPTLSFAGQFASAYPLGVGVSQAKPKLETEVRAVLDKLASQGVLETLRRKWFGDLPPLKVTDTSASPDASGAVDASATP